MAYPPTGYTKEDRKAATAKRVISHKKLLAKMDAYLAKKESK